MKQPEEHKIIITFVKTPEHPNGAEIKVEILPHECDETTKMRMSAKSFYQQITQYLGHVADKANELDKNKPNPHEGNLIRTNGLTDWIHTPRVGLIGVDVAYDSSEGTKHTDHMAAEQAHRKNIGSNQQG